MVALVTYPTELIMLLDLVVFTDGDKIVVHVGSHLRLMYLS